MTKKTSNWVVNIRNSLINIYKYQSLKGEIRKWFDPRFSGIVGGIIGSSIGVLGGVWGTMAGFLVRKGKHKRLVLSFAIVLIIIGITSLFTGVYALIIQQPYHVWYPFLLTELILTSDLIPKYLSIK